LRFLKKLDVHSIKLLSFDLDNTLYDCQSVLCRAESWFTEYLCDRYGLGGECRDYAFWKKIKNDVLKNDPNLANDVTELRIKSLIVAFNYLKIPLEHGYATAQALVDRFIKKRSQGIIDPKIVAMLYRLKKSFPLVAVSNGNLRLGELGLEGVFERDFRPNLMGVRRKPYADLFSLCAKAYHLYPHEILHIGDDPYTDVLGAVHSGCLCAWLYRGYTGISDDESQIRALPHVVFDRIEELEILLL